MDVLFGLALPYKAPESSVGAYLWRKRLWFETTFALSMMQPWEKLVLLVGLTSCFVLFGTAGYLYLPDHIAFVAGRAKYYLLGQENPDATVAQSIQRLVASWSWNETGTRVASVTEL
ncbi:hypothetical protein PHLGIDRAFT_80323 [Phlebiopsis gigantea 11061_1 CR5-6]|uniref:Uncharacterized protein n=1 Tax=Phlebiopsis gigantea (strain 11061_1 CR5-6) TaxID=745531 RepID=A0A0C3RZ46_PHLG1|nr:hypothetical protein PHLGIDRAFT_80323 [Phlebiopsis gigantea 11061_1 CR5-6]